MKPIRALLIGAGNRGMYAYGGFALRNPVSFQFVGVCDTNSERRARFSELHEIPPSARSGDWNAFLSSGIDAEAVFVCTPDRLHVEPALAAMRNGYDVILEKPMATDLDSCFLLEKESLRLDRRVIVCHVLRHTPFFSALKGLVDSGAVGRLLTVSLNECIGYYHFAHSYVRGNWRSGALSSPAILAKSSHDMDILHWLIGSPSSSVSSTGDRVWFRKENAPPDAPARCLDGCRHRDECPFYAPRWYLTEDTGWPASVISEDTSLAARIEALRTGPYGRCVYACDNDVVDHQAVIIRFENGVIATFTLSAFTREITRTIRLMGSKGEISGDLRKGEIEISDFLSGNRQLMRVEAAETGHQGGDEGLMREVERVIRSEDSEVKSRSDISEAMESHRLCFASERARLKSVVVDMDEFRRPG